MFDFENANEKQREAIKYTDGPLLIIAGPGTGKTFTLVKRIVYLIEEKNVKPEEIMVATFTEKAAKELVTRISNELKKSNIRSNINDMYIGTFHSICLRIINENIEYSKIRKNYSVLDEVDQKFFIYQNIQSFKDIPGFDENLLEPDYSSGENIQFDYDGPAKYIIKRGTREINRLKNLPPKYLMQEAGKVTRIVKTLLEELPDIGSMKKDEGCRMFAEILTRYIELTRKNNVLDFSSIQTEAYRMLTKEDEVLKKIQKNIRYVMVDEYQDTNTIQEKIVFKIGQKTNNICVVGDDDQGLYRFRGAHVKNILQFENKFEKNTCKVVKIEQNYRSTDEIIDFYNFWMNSDDKNWNGHRLEKKIRAVKETKPYPSVVKVSTKNGENWNENILSFIQRLKKEKKITDYNQIAFLFSSVKGYVASDLQDYLEDNCIDVYSPRAQKFFKRNEIKLIIGILVCVFKDYYDELKENRRDYEYTQKDISKKYYLQCVKYLATRFKINECLDIKEWIEEKRKILENIKDRKEEMSFTDFVYEIFGSEHFRKILSTDLKVQAVKQRALRNMAIFTQKVAKFENIYRVEKFTEENLNYFAKKFFDEYLDYFYPDKIGEYEDDEIYVPEGCVSFMTIHQSKGMEFPIVVACSLDWAPNHKADYVEEKLKEIKEKFTKSNIKEDEEEMKNYDFWRKYYTSFSRAQNMLVLTCQNEQTLDAFKNVYEKTIDVRDIGEDGFENMETEEIKESIIKNSYSFTTDVNLYKECPRKYKFFRELGFAGKDTKSMIFGSLVHQSIEDINKKLIENKDVNSEDIENIISENIYTIEKANNKKFTQEENEKARQQVENYLEKNKDNLKDIIAAEQDISVVKDGYIIKGQIDMITRTKDGLEIIDFKTGKKPDPKAENAQREVYEKQISLYAYMVEKNTGEKIDKMTLYYTAEDDPKISYDFDRKKVEKSAEEFDQTVKKIMKKDFSGEAKNEKICKNCLMKYYCRAEKKSEVKNG